jgi:hypothetical protein
VGFHGAVEAGTSISVRIQKIKRKYAFIDNDGNGNRNIDRVWQGMGLSVGLKRWLAPFGQFRETDILSILT